MLLIIYHTGTAEIRPRDETWCLPAFKARGCGCGQHSRIRNRDGSCVFGILSTALDGIVASYVSPDNTAAPVDDRLLNGFARAGYTMPRGTILIWKVCEWEGAREGCRHLTDIQTYFWVRVTARTGNLRPAQGRPESSFCPACMLVQSKHKTAAGTHAFVLQALQSRHVLFNEWRSMTGWQAAAAC